MDPRINSVLEFIRGNLQRPLSVSYLAASVNLSYSRLEHLFKAETGLTLVNHLKQLRIEKARELLETTFLTNQQIIVRVGLCDESHFARDFKKAHGLSPSEYRKRHHATDNLALIADEST